MKKNAVKVCIRTRPTQNFAQDNLLIDELHNSIQVKFADEDPGGVLNNKQNSFKFSFDHVFHNVSQVQVYDLYARDTVQAVVDGINGAVMSYGQTGSGKTFTMNGDVQNYEHRGVAPRSISQLFNEINSRVEYEFKVSCTFMEIYNERIYDLLGDLSNADQATDYTIAEEKDGRGTFVRGLAEVEVKDEQGALNLLFSGGLSRTIATHKLNKRSNRSHSIFTLYLQQRLRSGVSERVVHSKLHLVDLAGSERLKKTVDETGDAVTKKESMSINQSLTYLEQCVIALARRNQSHIPYRQSKLTNILKDCLGANCNTVMIACIWGEASHLEETVSTLRLASRMMRVQNETSAVETIDPSALIKKQDKIIKALKQELLMHDALVERTGVAYDPYTPEQQESISQMLERYVDATELEEENVLNITSYRQMLEICRQFKKKLLTSRADAKTAQENLYLGYTAGGNNTRGFNNTNGTNDTDFAADTKIAEVYDPTAPLVGDLGESKGFSLGVAKADSKPQNGIEYDSKQYSPGKTSMNRGNVAPFSPKGGAKHTSFDAAYSPTKSINDLNETSFMSGNNHNNQSLFEQFSKSDGKALFQSFVSTRTELKDYRSKCKELGGSTNDAKNEIDDLQTSVDMRKASRIEMAKRGNNKTDVVDEEEFRLSKALKEAKQRYKNSFEQLQRYRNYATEAQAKLNDVKSEMAMQFNKWSTSNNYNTSHFSTDMMFSPDSKNNNRSNNNDPFASSNMHALNGANNGLLDHNYDDTDQLDDQEAFDKLEMERVMANDPDSLAFFQAQKTRRANIAQNFSNIRQLQKNKRSL